MEVKKKNSVLKRLLAGALAVCVIGTGLPGTPVELGLLKPAVASAEQGDEYEVSFSVYDDLSDSIDVPLVDNGYGNAVVGNNIWQMLICSFTDADEDEIDVTIAPAISLSNYEPTRVVIDYKEGFNSKTITLYYAVTPPPLQMKESLSTKARRQSEMSLRLVILVIPRLRVDRRKIT